MEILDENMRNYFMIIYLEDKPYFSKNIIIRIRVNKLAIDVWYLPVAYMETGC